MVDVLAAVGSRLQCVQMRCRLHFIYHLDVSVQLPCMMDAVGKRSRILMSWPLSNLS